MSTREWPPVMATEDAVQYLESRIGRLAPTLSTLAGWARPSFRAANRELIERLKIPEGVRLDKKVGWERDELERYADAVTDRVKAKARSQRP